MIRLSIVVFNRRADQRPAMPLHEWDQPEFVIEKAPGGALEDTNAH